MPTTSAGRCTPSARPVIGSVEVLVASSAPGRACCSASLSTRCLSAWSSNTASTMTSQPARSAASPVGRDPGEEGVGVLLRHPAAGDLLADEPGDVRLALLGRLGRDVLEDDVDPDLGEGVGDAGAHHPGAEHADPGRGELRRAVGTGGAAVDAVQVEPERLDHVGRDLADDEVDEVPALDDERGVDVDLQALHRRRQDRVRRRVGRALELLGQVGRERGQRRGQRRRRRRAAGHLVALDVVGLLRRLVGQHPGAGLGDQLVAVGGQLVDQAELQRLLRTQLLALQEQLEQRRRQAQQPDRADDARRRPAAGRG